MFHARLRADLELRLLEERHAPIHFALVDQDRHYLREWLGWVDATETEEDSLTFIRVTRERFASKGEITAGVWFQDRFAGVISTQMTDLVNRKAEVGYWLGKSFQGQGIMTEACRALVRHALGEMDLNRVEIRCATGNTRSSAIPARLGFTHEATLREAQLLHGKYHDLEVWSMLRKELRD
jgi:ribosomal-protein-serine acetyltransferase